MGCFTGGSIRRYFDRKLHLREGQEGEDDVMRCFEAARFGKYDIFSLTKVDTKDIQCWTGRDAKKNLKKYQVGSGCYNGTGGQDSFDIYLVPGRVISGEYFPK